MLGEYLYFSCSHLLIQLKIDRRVNCKNWAILDKSLIGWIYSAQLFFVCFIFPHTERWNLEGYGKESYGDKNSWVLYK